jgi:hypothetical protein
MVARLLFDDDGNPINRPSETLAQQIGWHRSQIQWLESSGSRFAARSIDHHRNEIARLTTFLPSSNH